MSTCLHLKDLIRKVKSIRYASSLSLCMALLPAKLYLARYKDPMAYVQGTYHFFRRSEVQQGVLPLFFSLYTLFFSQISYPCRGIVMNDTNMMNLCNELRHLGTWLRSESTTKFFFQLTNQFHFLAINDQSRFFNRIPTKLECGLIVGP